MITLNNKYSELPEIFRQKINPEYFSHTHLHVLNKSLQSSFPEISNLNKDELTQIFSGQIKKIPITPTALAYSGHQFGNFTTLGDGRAIVLGQLKSKDHQIFDIQLKGSGRTKYSRGGDGKAALTSVLREYLYSEAMYHLNVPTTRALAVVETESKVFREEPKKGGILTRLAKSLIRVGTIEFASYQCEKDDLKKLIDFAIDNHFPELKNQENPYLDFFEKVMNLQIDLIIEWFRIGFIHGVLNTDNVSIVGETIDYGPCTFMNQYNPGAVYSRIDVNKRYAFGAQSNITHWNMTALANALLPLIDEDEKKSIEKCTAILGAFSTIYAHKWLNMMRSKIGITHPSANDYELIKELLNLMQKHQLDYTNTFNFLAELKVPNEKSFAVLDEWKAKWTEHLITNGSTFDDATRAMSTINPVYIIRNVFVEESLDSIEKSNDWGKFNGLLELIQKPYEDQQMLEKYKAYSEDFDAKYQTHCNT
jgi:uncharacterized protein YdiU (UPF0061 family)